MKKPIAVIALAVVTIIACKHELPIPPAAVITPTTATNNLSSQIYFQEDILPIFRSSCAKSPCHDVATHQNGYTFDTYDNIMNSQKDAIRPGEPNNSKVYKMITEKDTTKRMPKIPYAALTSAQIELIKRWITEGAKNTTSGGGGCDTTAFTYAQSIRPIIDANCVGCHNGPNAGFGLDYTTYAGVRAVALNGRLIGAITHATGYSPMPKNSAQLSNCKIVQIKKWIQAGALNN